MDQVRPSPAKALVSLGLMLHLGRVASAARLALARPWRPTATSARWLSDSAAELLNSPRESMDYDVVIVGGGPAGLSAAIRLKQLSATEGKDLSVCIVEKGHEVGAHILSGNVFEPRALNELIPDWKEKGAPLETKAASDSFYFLTQGVQLYDGRGEGGLGQGQAASRMGDSCNGSISPSRAVRVPVLVSFLHGGALWAFQSRLCAAAARCVVLILCLWRRLAALPRSVPSSSCMYVMLTLMLCSPPSPPQARPFPCPPSPSCTMRATTSSPSPSSRAGLARRRRRRASTSSLAHPPLRSCTARRAR